MNYFDLHCDTPYELYRKQTKFDENSHHVSLDKTEKAFECYAQFAAYCASPRKSDAEAYDTYVKCTDYFFAEMSRLKDRASICTSFAGLEKAVSEGKAAIFPTVEDARILDGDLSRLDLLYSRGCRILTLVWGGTSCIGGAHNTEVGLTDFGKAVAEKCFEMDIVPDISHSSEQSVDDLLEIAEKYKKPIIASHSDLYEVFPHTRNLRKRHLDTIISLGGSVGLNLCPWHIKKMLISGTPKPDFSNMDELVFDKCTLDDVMRHLEGYLELGARDVLGMGCDLDGTDLPEGFSGVDCLYLIADEMAKRGYTDELIHKIFWKNDLEFIKKNFN